MSKKELTALDVSLCTSDIKDKILIRKRGFYVYYNEPTKNSKEIKIQS